MQYVRSLAGSVTSTWNQLNPATLSGAIDVIVVEEDDGSLACSPFHVRFGKMSLLRPYDRKVEFKVNGEKRDYPMKLGEGGEAFFVFETSQTIPEGLQTSPVVSPVASPEAKPIKLPRNPDLPEPEFLDLATESDHKDAEKQQPYIKFERAKSEAGAVPTRPGSNDGRTASRPTSGDWSGRALPVNIGRSKTDETVPSGNLSKSFDNAGYAPEQKSLSGMRERSPSERSTSPPPFSTKEAVARSINLSKKLWTSNIPSTINDRGDLMLDMSGWKSSEEEALRAELIARKILTEELEGPYDIGSLMEVDDNGNLWIYSSEEAKRAAEHTSPYALKDQAAQSAEALSDPGYQSDDARSESDVEYGNNLKGDADSGVGLSPPPSSHRTVKPVGDPNRNYAKTLRLTSDQLKALNLKSGLNTMNFSVGRAVINASIFLWRHDVPVVISDIDGTITKSDVKGHLYYYIGSDWTHTGVAKLYTDITSNGYNIIYLSSRSVGQSDSTRTYLNGVAQNGYKLPKGPILLSPDRTFAALRREVYMRKPEIFKMACLRDIMNLFNKPAYQTPFYAGFGNRITDALSYRSVNIPRTRIFTINSNAEVSIDMLSLNTYKTGYASMGEILDHYFPPVTMLVKNGGEEFTDFNYWREPTIELDEFSASESEDDDADEASIRSEDEAADGLVYGEDSYYSRDSIDDRDGSIVESVEGGDDSLAPSIYQDFQDDDPLTDVDEEDEQEDDEEEDEESTMDEVSIVARATRKLTITQDNSGDATRDNLRELSRVLNSPERTR